MRWAGFIEPLQLLTDGTDGTVITPEEEHGGSS